MTAIRDWTILSLVNEQQSYKIIKTIRDKVDEISGYSPSILHSPGDCMYMYEIASGKHDDLQANNNCAIQVGTFLGGSACMIAKGLEDGNIYAPLIAIDIFCYARQDLGETTDDIFIGHKRMIDVHHFQNRIASVYHDSVGFLQLLSQWNTVARFVFIDTDHTYDSTLKECELSYSLLCTNATAWLLVHDYVSPNEGNIQAVHDFIDNLSGRNYTVFRPVKDSSLFIVKFNPIEL